MEPELWIMENEFSLLFHDFVVRCVPHQQMNYKSKPEVPPFSPQPSGLFPSGHSALKTLGLINLSGPGKIGSILQQIGQAEGKFDSQA